MDGTEARSRLIGSTKQTGGPRTGRPRNNAPQLLLNPADPLATSLQCGATDLDWKAGSVVQCVIDGELQTVVLLNNVSVAPLYP